MSKCMNYISGMVVKTRVASITQGKIIKIKERIVWEKKQQGKIIKIKEQIVWEKKQQ